jgi:hypothetical protein
MQKGFNLADLNVAKADVGVPMAVLNPKTSEPLVFEDEQGSLQPVTITLLGAESGVVRAERRVQVNRRFRRGLAQASKITAEETEAEALTLLVKQTVAWQGVALGDDLLECTEANVRRVYTEFPWIRQQVDTFVNDISNYLGN